MQIIKAILDGERAPLILAGLRDRRCKNNDETIARSLHGNFRPEYLFSLKHAVDLYVFYQGQIAECDRELLSQLATFDAAEGSDNGSVPGGQATTLEDALQRISGRSD